MQATVAQTILKLLSAWGVRNIYGVSGDAVLGFLAALGRQEEVRFLATATEQGASFMACGEARVSGRPGVCLATEGSGALNLVNGVADAHRDGLPMLVITGQVETAKLSSNAKQYIDQQQLFAPVTGSTTLLTRPESTVAVFQAALEKAVGDGTPCHISVPKDIFTSPLEDCPLPAPGRPGTPGLQGNVAEAVKIIGQAHKPIVLAGRAALPHREKVHQLAGQTAPPQKVVSLLNGILPEDAIITIDAGEFMHWFDRGFIAKKQQVIISDYWRSLGSGLPYGLGAQVAEPKKKVVVLTGDGGFIMSMQEMLTAVRYSLPVAVIVFNNGKYLLKKHRMEKEGWTPFGVEVKLPDFINLAKACGADGIRVEEPDSLGKILAGAMGSERPTIIDIPVSDVKPEFIGISP